MSCFSMHMQIIKCWAEREVFIKKILNCPLFYIAIKCSVQKSAADVLSAESIPGSAGVDYPIFSQPPDTSFACDGYIQGTGVLIKYKVRMYQCSVRHQHLETQSDKRATCSINIYCAVCSVHRVV